MSQALVHVAIAILQNHGQILVGWRQASQHQGNKYEFPGGKVEEGETPQQACQREIREETGLNIEHWTAFDVIQHNYPDLQVNLHVFQAQVLDSQLAQITAPWQFYPREELTQLNFPKANVGLIERLDLAPTIKISANLEDYLSLDTDRVLYWRTNLINVTEIEAALLQLGQQLSYQSMAHDQHDAVHLNRLTLNVELWKQLKPELQQQIGTVHFKQHQLMQGQIGDLPLGKRCIAACHDLAALQHAQYLGFDAALLSPVQPTASHPDAEVLGWTCFAEWCQSVHIPVYALGGVSADHLAQVRKNQGYGVAGIRHF